MWAKLFKVSVATALVLLLAYCNQQGEPIKPDPDSSENGVWQNVVRVTFMTQAELDKKCKEVSCNKHNTARGFAAQDRHGRCLIYQLKPTHVDDDATTTLGHEVLHCVFGKYHVTQ